VDSTNGDPHVLLFCVDWCWDLGLRGDYGGGCKHIALASPPCGRLILNSLRASYSLIVLDLE
jgi:hypothetical protein